MTKNHLRLVDADYVASRRAYVLPLDLADFAATVSRLDDAGHIVINGDEDRLVDEIDLRVHLVGLSAADDLVLPSIWWTSATAHQLVTLAGWMGVRFLHEDGTAMETVGVKGTARG